jgi:hypothetical protein
MTGRFAHVLTVYTVEYKDETGDSFTCYQLGFPQTDFWQVKALSVGLYVPAEGWSVEGSAYAPMVRRTTASNGKAIHGIKDAILHGYLKRIEVYEATVPSPSPAVKEGGSEDEADTEPEDGIIATTLGYL